MNKSGFEALVILSLIHGMNSETLVYTTGIVPRQPLGPCSSNVTSKENEETIPTSSYLPLVTSSFIKGPPESPWQVPGIYGLILIARLKGKMQVVAKEKLR